jgi:hypothetical protein
MDRCLAYRVQVPENLHAYGVLPLIVCSLQVPIPPSSVQGMVCLRLRLWPPELRAASTAIYRKQPLDSRWNPNAFSYPNYIYYGDALFLFPSIDLTSGQDSFV